MLIPAAAGAGWFRVAGRAVCAWTAPPPAVARWSAVGLIPQAGMSLALIVVLSLNLPNFEATPP